MWLDFGNLHNLKRFLGAYRMQVLVSPEAFALSPECIGLLEKAVEACDDSTGDRPILCQLLWLLSHRVDHRGFAFCSVLTRRRLAESSYIPETALAQLAEDENVPVRGAVARNPTTPISILARLAEDRFEAVRKDVAGNTQTPSALLEQLAGDEKWRVRAEVAANPNAQASLLEQFAQDGQVWVRRAAAGNEQAPETVLEVLAQDGDEFVRQEVEGNMRNRKRKERSETYESFPAVDYSRLTEGNQRHPPPEVRYQQQCGQEVQCPGEEQVLTFPRQPDRLRLDRVE